MSQIELPTNKPKPMPKKLRLCMAAMGLWPYAGFVINFALTNSRLYSATEDILVYALFFSQLFLYVPIYVLLRDKEYGIRKLGKTALLILLIFGMVSLLGIILFTLQYPLLYLNPRPAVLRLVQTGDNETKIEGLSVTGNPYLSMSSSGPLVNGRSISVVKSEKVRILWGEDPAFVQFMPDNTFYISDSNGGVAHISYDAKGAFKLLPDSHSNGLTRSASYTAGPGASRQAGQVLIAIIPWLTSFALNPVLLLLFRSNIGKQLIISIILKFSAAILLPPAMLLSGSRTKFDEAMSIATVLSGYLTCAGFVMTSWIMLKIKKVPKPTEAAFEVIVHRTKDS